MNKSLKIAISGSTHRTAQCAQALLDDHDFSIPWIITPKPKPIGRKKIITKNPLHVFAEKNNIPVILIDKKVEKDDFFDETEKPDFLLVVDFGYIIPNWLLKLPKIAPLNIHPSELPKWRGSSPAQFSILHGDTKSAVTLMVMNDKLDQGPIIHQEHFDVDPHWNSEDYYQHSFDLICKVLPEKINNFAKNSTSYTPQPLKSPTITASRLTKQDTFIEWEILKFAIAPQNSAQTKKKLTLNTLHSTLISEANQHHKSWPITLHQATKAFSPWPLLWTIVPTDKGEKRMQILETKLTANNLQLRTVKLEGKSATTWNEIKDQIHI